MIRERETFERELESLGIGEGSLLHGFKKLFSSPLACIGVSALSGTVHEGTIDDPDATIDGKAIKLTVRHYMGRSNAVALVFGGVHSNEDEGTTTVRALRAKLDAAYTATPAKSCRFHTFLIENVRAERDVLQPKSADDRYIGGVEPNRNFPLAGEGLAAVNARNKRLGFDLVDPDTRRFPDLPPRKPKDFDPAAKLDDHTSKLLLAETRLLVKLMGCIQPHRALSAHSHTLKNVRGDGPGIFVDPRGGFDTDLDAPLTAEGRADDALTQTMFKLARTKVAASKLTKDQQKQAFAGNLPGSKAYKGETLHYSYGAPKSRGTSFGMWASAPVDGQGSEDRRAATTITLELPKWGATKKHTVELAEIWADVILEKFLELT